MKCNDKAFVEQDVGKRPPVPPGAEVSSWNNPKVGGKGLSVVLCGTAALGKLDLICLALLSTFLRIWQLLWVGFACILLPGLLN